MSIGFTKEFDQELLTHSSIVRGLILNATIMIERSIDGFLVNHFCKSKELRDELLRNVFATRAISFDSKIKIFDNITDVHHKEYKKLNLKNIHNKLKKFNVHRNIIAHCLVDLKPESLRRFKETKEVTFIKIEPTIKREFYTIASAKNIADNIWDTVEPISRIY